MRFPPAVFFSIVAIGLAASAFAQPATPANPHSNGQSPLQSEAIALQLAHDAIYRGDSASWQSLLQQSPDSRLNIAGSSALAQRAGSLCAWLMNENRYGAAMSVARWAVAQLATQKEAKTGDRVNRLYWEAWLEGTVLENHDRAVTLLESAEVLAPADARLQFLHGRFAGAIKSFGH